MRGILIGLIRGLEGLVLRCIHGQTLGIGVEDDRVVAVRRPFGFRQQQLPVRGRRTIGSLGQVASPPIIPQIHDARVIERGRLAPTTGAKERRAGRSQIDRVAVYRDAGAAGPRASTPVEFIIVQRFESQTRADGAGQLERLHESLVGNLAQAGLLGLASLGFFLLASLLLLTQCLLPRILGRIGEHGIRHALAEPAEKRAQQRRHRLHEGIVGGVVPAGTAAAVREIMTGGHIPAADGAPAPAGRATGDRSHRGHEARQQRDHEQEHDNTDPLSHNATSLADEEKGTFYFFARASQRPAGPTMAKKSRMSPFPCVTFPFSFSATTRQPRTQRMFMLAPPWSCCGPDDSPYCLPADCCLYCHW